MIEKPTILEILRIYLIIGILMLIVIGLMWLVMKWIWDRYSMWIIGFFLLSIIPKTPVRLYFYNKQ